MRERLDRSQQSREDLLAEILNAEAILDGMKAKEGLTLWGRIASIKDKITDLELSLELAESDYADLIEQV